MQSAVLYTPGIEFEQILAEYRRYNAIIGEVATNENVLLIGGEARIPGSPMHFIDSVHFTDAGNRRQASRVSEILLASPDLSARVTRR